VRTEWVIWGVLAAVVIVFVLWFAGDWGQREAATALRARADSSAALDVAVLNSELEKQRSLPFILAHDPDVSATLLTPNQATVTAMNRKLTTLNSGVGSDVIYLLNRNATTIASSNWQEPTSFVGKNYSFRPYFVQAANTGQGEYFALGTVSLQSGLYISRRIEYDGALLGVIVVKVQFGNVEQVWLDSDAKVYVTDPRGIVLLSGIRTWRFQTESPLSATSIAAIHASNEFGEAALTPLPILRTSEAFGDDFVTLAGGKLFLAREQDVGSTQWQLHVLLPATVALDAGAYIARMTALGIVGPILFLSAIMLYWRQRSITRTQEELEARAELERRVEARTEDLQSSNVRLLAEIDERQKVEANLQTARDELAQGNRLAMLGQISAGLAHEINQPVAAIRTYADNALAYLDRMEAEAVRLNLVTIAQLTELIGSITGELRGFSRKATGLIGPTLVRDVVACSLLMMGIKARQQAVELTADEADPGLCVIANRARLAQVLVNLLQNALEAMHGYPGKKLHIGISVLEDEVQLIVADTGPGIPPAIMAALFTPFVTTKPRGVGLGLVISKNIVDEFGGRLDVVSEPNRGSCFTLSLRKVPQ
jgi:two-component system C4-dicarboxylate transport sensor histidine kinase DctB